MNSVEKALQAHKSIAICPPGTDFRGSWNCTHWTARKRRAQARHGCWRHKVVLRAPASLVTSVQAHTGLGRVWSHRHQNQEKVLQVFHWYNTMTVKSSYQNPSWRQERWVTINKAHKLYDPGLCGEQALSQWAKPHHWAQGDTKTHLAFNINKYKYLSLHCKSYMYCFGHCTSYLNLTCKIPSHTPPPLFLELCMEIGNTNKSISICKQVVKTCKHTQMMRACHLVNVQCKEHITV